MKAGPGCPSGTGLNGWDGRGSMVLWITDSNQKQRERRGDFWRLKINVDGLLFADGSCAVSSVEAGVFVKAALSQ